MKYICGMIEGWRKLSRGKEIKISLSTNLTLFFVCFGLLLVLFSCSPQCFFNTLKGRQPTNQPTNWMKNMKPPFYLESDRRDTCKTKAWKNKIEGWLCHAILCVRVSVCLKGGWWKVWWQNMTKTGQGNWRKQIVLQIFLHIGKSVKFYSNPTKNKAALSRIILLIKINVFSRGLWQFTA